MINIFVAGSSQHTTLLTNTLINETPDFAIQGILTPAPKPSGRHQEVLPNPLHQLGIDKNINTILVDKKIDQQIRLKLSVTAQTDILLVVDFGYIVPDWLLAWPKTATVNVHPSLLPRWRGSSPAQFALLFADKISATTIMQLDSGLDTGPILSQHQFPVDPSWNAAQYYNFAFNLAAENLGDTLKKLHAGIIKPEAQPVSSPTMVARRLNKADGFIPWQLLRSCQGQAARPNPASLSTSLPDNSLLQLAYQHHQSWPKTIHQASKAFYPWPGLWTEVNTSKGTKILKILNTSLNNEVLTLEKVQLAGLQPSSFNQIKNQLL